MKREVTRGILSPTQCVHCCRVSGTFPNPSLKPHWSARKILQPSQPAFNVTVVRGLNTYGTTYPTHLFRALTCQPDSCSLALMQQEFDAHCRISFRVGLVLGLPHGLGFLVRLTLCNASQCAMRHTVQCVTLCNASLTMASTAAASCRLGSKVSGTT